MWQDAGTVARLGFEAVEAGRPVCVTGAPNQAIAAISHLLPESLALELTA